MIIEGRYSVFLLLAECYNPATAMKIKTYSRNKCCDFLSDHDTGDQTGFFICNGGKIRERFNIENILLTYGEYFRRENQQAAGFI